MTCFFSEAPWYLNQDKPSLKHHQAWNAKDVGTRDWYIRGRGERTCSQSWLLSGNQNDLGRKCGHTSHPYSKVKKHAFCAFPSSSFCDTTRDNMSWRVAGLLLRPGCFRGGHRRLGWIMVSYGRASKWVCLKMLVSKKVSFRFSQGTLKAKCGPLLGFDLGICFSPPSKRPTNPDSDRPRLNTP